MIIPFIFLNKHDFKPEYTLTAQKKFARIFLLQWCFLKFIFRQSERRHSTYLHMHIGSNIAAVSDADSIIILKPIQHLQIRKIIIQSQLRAILRIVEGQDCLPRSQHSSPLHYTYYGKFRCSTSIGSSEGCGKIWTLWKDVVRLYTTGM